MKLQDKLDELRNQFESSAPPEALAIMHRATEELLNSGIMDRVLKTGDQASAFSLPDIQGQQVSSSNFLNKAPLVVCFYRGAW